ncbi:MAG: DUF2079 domain-containing protein [Candidatus Pacebacteria bacterium]|nr:DUF2079 domain-containing protein [Candidatus Paceibacterota bacterium]
MIFKTEKSLILSLIFLYILIFGVFACVRHYDFQTQAFDMGIFNQSFWNSLHGHFMESSIENTQGVSNHFGMHWSPILLTLLPGYAIFPSPYFLLIIQTVILAFGAWPLYLLAKKVLGESGKRIPLLLTIAYLIFPALHWVNSFDFHELAFLVPILIAAFYFIEIKNWLWSIIFLILAAAVKEDAILIVLFAGIYLILKSNKENNSWLTKQRKIGLAIIISAIIYFLIATKLIMPAFGGGLLHLSRFSDLGETPGQIIKNLIINPALLINTIFAQQKLFYLLWLFLPVAFLPLLSPISLIILIPGLAENLLSSWGAQTAGLYHYDALLIGGIFIGAVYGAKNFLNIFNSKEKYLRWALIILPITAFLMRSPISPISFPIELFRANDHWESYRQIVENMPSKASISAETHIIPHLSNREKIYKLGDEPEMTDIVIIDGSDLSGFNNEESFQKYADSYMETGKYNFTAIKDRYFILFKKELPK